LGLISRWRLGPGIRELRFVNFGHWTRLGEILKRAESGIQWWLGDWMNYGENQYREKYAQAVDAHEETGLNVDTLRNYQWVAERVPPVMRITNLPWSFHQAVAALSPDEQGSWLAEAKGAGWTYRELKGAIRKAEQKRNFKLVEAVLEKVWERIQDGCYTADAILKCGECGKNIFDLDADQIKLYMQQLVEGDK